MHMAGDTEQLFRKLDENECERLVLKKALTKDIYEQIKLKRTKFGGTLGDCIRAGCENPTKRGIGSVACDPDAYNVFAPLMNRIIQECHSTERAHHPPIDFGDLNDLGGLDLKDVDPDGVFIKSTRVRLARNLEGFGFHPVISLQDRLDIEATIVQALEQLKGTLMGEYFSLANMSREAKQQLVKDHFLFNDCDSWFKAAGVYGDWPSGRGIFFNREKTFLVWVGEEDHMRIISMQAGSDLQAVYKRLLKGMKCLEETGLNWIRDDRLGYVTFCATNLGTTLRASVHVDIPMLSQSAHFQEFCSKHKLQVRGVDGEHTSMSGTVFDISNKRRLGLTEIQAVREMQEGVKAIIEEEKRLSSDCLPYQI